MTTKSIVFALSGIVLLTASCKKELEPQESSASSDSTAVAAQAVPGVPAVQPTTTAPAKIEPVQQAVQPAQVGKGMNPAHGQPGHRCDIPVGASLSSAPAKPAAPAVTPSQTASRIVPQQTQPAQGTPAILNAPAATQATAPGMNPPHGQDGHRCDVAVGAPLPK